MTPGLFVFYSIIGLCSLKRNLCTGRVKQEGFRHLPGHCSQSIEAAAVHGRYNRGLQAFQLFDGLVRFLLRYSRKSQMKTTKDRMYFLYTRNRLGLADRIDDSGMGAPGDDDQPFVFQTYNQGQIIGGFILFKLSIFEASEAGRGSRGRSRGFKRCLEENFARGESGRSTQH